MVQIEVIDDGYNSCANEFVKPESWGTWFQESANFLFGHKVISAASTAKETISRVGNSLVGRKIKEVTKVTAAETAGAIAGGTVVSTVLGNVFQKTAEVALGPGAIVVSFATATILDGEDDLNPKTRQWVMTTFITSSLCALLGLMFPGAPLVIGCAGGGLGYVVGNVLGGYAMVEATGQHIPLIDFEDPIGNSYVARALPPAIFSSCVSWAWPAKKAGLIGGISKVGDLVLQTELYYALPVGKKLYQLHNKIPGKQGRFELLYPAGIMREFLRQGQEQGLPGLAQNLVSGEFVRSQVLRILEGDAPFVGNAAYNIVARTLNHYSAFLAQDPEIQQAIGEFRQAFKDELYDVSLAAVLAKKLSERFPKLAGSIHGSERIKDSLKGVTESLVKTTIESIKESEQRFFGIDLTSDEERKYLEAFLTVYIDGFLQYILANIVAFQNPLSDSEIQDFYINLNQLICQLYIGRLPLIGGAENLIEAGADAVIKRALPVNNQGQEEEDVATTSCFVSLLFVLRLVAKELYEFFRYLIFGSYQPA